MPGFNIPSIVAGCHDEFAVEAGTRFESSPSSSVETLRSHRFRFEIFASVNRGSSIWLAYPKQCTRPNPEIDEITIHNGPDQIYRPGKVKWSPVQVTFYEIAETGDGLTPSALFTLWAQNTIDLETSSIGSLRPADLDSPTLNFNALIEMLDGAGNPLWQYWLYNCWPTKISPANISYDESNILTTDVTLRFDKAFENIAPEAPE